MSLSEGTRYVLGFAFDTQARHVVLIRKNRPTWQAGKFNGLGGHVEEREPYSSAMAREFTEECGVYIPERAWQAFATLIGRGWLCRCFRAFTDDIAHATTLTDEQVEIIDVNELCRYPTIPGLAYLLPLAVDDEVVGLPTFNYSK